MAASENEVLKPILLRSSTPASNEKVLKYLETLQPGDPLPSDWESDDPRGNWSPQSRAVPLHQPIPRSSSQQHLHNLAGSTVSYGGAHQQEQDDDVASNQQEGMRSELGSLPAREPGPEDPPGPRYESFDSGPSFGNKGPLPDFDHSFARGTSGAFGTWQPTWGNGSIPNQPTGSGVKSPPPMTQEYLAPVDMRSPGRGPQNLQSQYSPSIAFNVVNPSTPPQSQAQQRSTSPTTRTVSDARSSHGVQTPPHSSRRTASKVPSALDPERVMSPVRSQKSHVTGRSQGTEYPPLPSSPVEGSYGGEHPGSPGAHVSHLERAPSVSPSVSPSDSQSQVYFKRASARSPPPKEVTQTPEVSPRVAPSRQLANGTHGAKSPTIPMSPQSHQHRPFSPYRHAHTQEDLLHAVLRSSAAQSQRQASQAGSGAPTATSKHEDVRRGADDTPKPSRPCSPEGDVLDPDEERIVQEALKRTSRTSYAPSALESEIVHSHFHDMELCVLLHEAEDPNAHEVVKKAVRKAVRQRVKKLGLKHDNESLKQYKRSFHNHDPNVHLQPDFKPQASEEAPEWAKELMNTMARVQERLDGIVPKIERLPSRNNLLYSGGDTRYRQEYRPEEDDDYDGRTPVTQTVNINTQPTGTGAESMFQPPETELVDDRQEVLDYDLEDEDDREVMPATTGGETRTREPMSEYHDGRDDSPGQQYLIEELYKLRVKPTGSQSGNTHRTWEIAKDDGEYDEDDHERGSQSGLPEIPDSNGEVFNNARAPSPPLPPIPQESQGELVSSDKMWPVEQVHGQNTTVPWQRIQQRLLSWAIIWPVSELDQALNSTTRGHQVDEVALSIWCTQCYKRYVRARMTDHPPQRVDRLFVPPNMADAISTAVFNGRHGDASGMLRDLWTPFGLEGMPRLLVVLMKHRSEENHWVVHKYSLPDGSLTTYDSYPEKTLADGRPLGWWFAIRVAWPNPSYPSPDHLMQKIVRMHRPMQLGIDNSVAAAGIWRNVLMGTRAERSVDLERLRDLINQEVKNLRQRKLMGKLYVGAPQPNWEDFQ